MAGSEHELKKKPKLTEEMVTEVTLSELEKSGGHYEISDPGV